MSQDAGPSSCIPGDSGVASKEEGGTVDGWPRAVIVQTLSVESRVNTPDWMRRDIAMA